MTNVRCPHPLCIKQASLPYAVVRRGHFRRKTDAATIQRYLCRNCHRGFSVATLDPCYRQHKRTINPLLRALLCGKFSQRRAAFVLNLDPGTVASRLRFFGMEGRKHLCSLRETMRGLTHGMFDEMQSSEHTKCKPIAIPMVTSPKNRLILAVGVASMPAQHPLVQISLKKYGPRPDNRAEAIVKIFEDVKPMFTKNAVLTTDMAPRYPQPIAMVLPHILHDAHKSRRARRSGQGELKKIGYDPLFNFNHTAAMVRDGVGSLVRQTWGNTKVMARLEDRLAMYAHYHNTVLIPHLEKRKSRKRKK